MPQSAAWRAPIRSANSIDPMARAAPIWRGSVQVPPASGIRPIRVKAWMKLALSVAITRSQASARLAPAPAAAPFTAASVGMGQSCSRRNSGSYSSRRTASRSRSARGVSDRSCPEQKARPAPVSTSARADPMAARIAISNSVRRVAFSAFITSGRLRVITARPSACETRRV